MSYMKLLINEKRLFISVKGQNPAWSDVSAEALSSLQVDWRQILEEDALHLEQADPN